MKKFMFLSALFIGSILSAAAAPAAGAGEHRYSFSIVKMSDATLVKLLACGRGEISAPNAFDNILKEDRAGEKVIFSTPEGFPMASDAEYLKFIKEGIYPMLPMVAGLRYRFENAAIKQAREAIVTKPLDAIPLQAAGYRLKHITIVLPVTDAATAAAIGQIALRLGCGR